MASPLFRQLMAVLVLAVEGIAIQSNRTRSGTGAKECCWCDRGLPEDPTFGFCGKCKRITFHAHGAQCAALQTVIADAYNEKCNKPSRVGRCTATFAPYDPEHITSDTFRKKEGDIVLPNHLLEHEFCGHFFSLDRLALQSVMNEDGEQIAVDTTESFEKACAKRERVDEAYAQAEGEPPEVRELKLKWGSTSDLYTPWRVLCNTMPRRKCGVVALVEKSVVVCGTRYKTLEADIDDLRAKDCALCKKFEKFEDMCESRPFDLSAEIDGLLEKIKELTKKKQHIPRQYQQ